MNSSQPSVAHVKYVLTSRLTMPVCAFLLLVIISRESDLLLGQYALVTTYYVILQVLPLLGLTPFIMREVARDPASAGGFFSTIGILSVVACVIINIAIEIGLGSLSYSSDVSNAIRIVGYSIVPGILAFLAETILISLHRARRVARISLIENGIRLLSSITVLTFGGGIESLIIVLVCTRLLAFLCYLVEMKNLVGEFRNFTPSKMIFKKTVFVLPTFLANSILTVLVSRLDYLVLSLFTSMKEIGHYAIAYRPLEIFMLFASAIMAASFPWLSKTYAKSRRNFVLRLKVIFSAGMFFLIPVTVVAFVLSTPYVWGMFHSQYPDALFITQLFTLLFFLVGMDLMSSFALNASDLQGGDLKALAWGGSVYVCMLFLLVPPLHGLGAWLSSVVALSTQLLIRLTILHKHFGWIIHSKDVRSAFVSGGIVVIIIALTSQWGVWSYVLLIINLLLIYPLLLAVTGVWAPLNVIRLLNRKGSGDLSTIAGLLDFVTRDIRRYRYVFRPKGMTGPCPAQCDGNSILAVALYRVSRCAFLKGHSLLARFCWQLNLILTKSDISPATVIGPGLVLVSPVHIVISAQVGRNVTFSPLSGIGISGRRNVGAGPGVAVIGDGVVFGVRAGVVGGVNIKRGTKLSSCNWIRNVRSHKKDG